MKRLWTLFICACLLWCFNVMAFAANSTGGDVVIDTVVPGSHTIAVVITGKGSVLRDGADVGGSITAVRHGDVTLTLSPGKGYILDKVLYNGEDLTGNVLSNAITLKSISRDGMLEVVFVSDPKDGTPQTGYNSSPWLWGLIVMVSMGGLVLTVKSRNCKHEKHHEESHV